jgi:hypothetical protein
MYPFIFVLSCSVAGVYPADPIKEYISLQACGTAGVEYMTKHPAYKCICPYRVAKPEEVARK